MKNIWNYSVNRQWRLGKDNNTFLGNVSFVISWYKRIYIAQNCIYISQKSIYFPRRHWRSTMYTVHFVCEFSGAQKFKFIENLEPLWMPGDSLIDLHFTFIFLSEILQRPTRRSLSPRKSSLRPEQKAKTIVSKKELCPNCQFSHRIAFLK